MTEPRRTSADDPVPLVAIGASAGGLAALRRLFSYMPDDLGRAFA